MRNMCAVYRPCAQCFGRTALADLSVAGFGVRFRV